MITVRMDSIDSYTGERSDETLLMGSFTEYGFLKALRQAGEVSGEDTTGYEVARWLKYSDRAAAFIILCPGYSGSGAIVIVGRIEVQA